MSALLAESYPKLAKLRSILAKLSKKLADKTAKQLNLRKD